MIGRLKYLKTIDRGELTVGRLVDAAHRRLLDIPHQVAWRLPTARNRDNNRRLLAFRDAYRGKRCVIIANGPSLATMDLRHLKDEVTFGMNRIYRLREQMGFLPTFLVTADIDVQLASIAPELQQVATTRFVNYNARSLFSEEESLLLVKETFRPRFSTDASRGVWGGHSVTYTCLQLAYFMGFSTVVLIGKDHNYQLQGVPGQVVYATGHEKDHAVKGYYAAGQRWRIPDYKGEEFAYSMARAAFEADGRRVLDATVGGKLTVFQKADFHSLFPT